MAEVYIALGTNKGKRLFYIQQALERLKETLSVEKISSLYLTEPVGTGGGWFVNCVVKAQTEKNPLQLLNHLLQIERKMGRIGKEKRRRSIDLDLLFYQDKIIEEENLTVPHPRLHQRRFVLLPLAEISPKLKHPVLQKTVEKLLQDLQDPHQVKKIESGSGN